MLRYFYQKMMLPYVVRVKIQFSELVKVRKLAKWRKTRTLDQIWRQLKRFAPKALRTRGGLSEKDRPPLEEYVWAFAFSLRSPWRPGDRSCQYGERLWESVLGCFKKENGRGKPEFHWPKWKFASYKYQWISTLHWNWCWWKMVWKCRFLGNLVINNAQIPQGG